MKFPLLMHFSRDKVPHFDLIVIMSNIYCIMSSIILSILNVFHFILRTTYEVKKYWDPYFIGKVVTRAQNV